MAYKKKQKNIFAFVLQSWVVRIFLLLFLSFVSLQVFEQYKVMQKTASKRIEAETVHANLLKEKTALEEEIHSNTVDYGVETQIRKNFDMQKAGEQVVVILDENQVNIPTREGPEYDTVQEAKPWYWFWD